MPLPFPEPTPIQGLESYLRVSEVLGVTFALAPVDMPALDLCRYTITPQGLLIIWPAAAGEADCMVRFVPWVQVLDIRLRAPVAPAR